MTQRVANYAPLAEQILVMNDKLLHHNHALVESMALEMDAARRVGLELGESMARIARDVDVAQSMTSSITTAMAQLARDEDVAQAMAPNITTVMAQIGREVAAARRMAPSFAEAMGQIARDVDVAQRMAPSMAEAMARQLNAAHRIGLDLAGAAPWNLDALRAVTFDADAFANMRPILDRLHADMLAERPARRYTAGAFALALFEAVTNARTDGDSPKDVMALWLTVLVFVLTHMMAYQSQQRVQTELRGVRGDVRGLRQVQREQAESIAALHDALRAVTARTADRDEQKAYAEVTAAGVLREAPSGASARVGSLRRGQKVRLLTMIGRWRFVEVLDGEESGETGWVYRRVLKMRVG